MKSFPSNVTISDDFLINNLQPLDLLSDCAQIFLSHWPNLNLENH
jgi:hypothetical protein